MTIFWILSAGLIGLALLFVLPPLLARREAVRDVDQDELNLAVYREQLQELDADLAAGNLDKTQYKASRRDLERELLYDVSGEHAGNQQSPRSAGSRVTALLLAIAVPSSAVALYLYLGSSAIIPGLEAVASVQPTATTPAAHPTTPGEGQMPSMDVLVQRLADKMEQNPDDLNGWLMLGRSYFAVNQPEKALQALEKAYGLAPENPDVLVAYAQALAANAGGSLAGRPAELVRTALETDATNATARWLDGLISYREENFARAVERWESLLDDLGGEGAQADQLRRSIADARERAGVPAAAAAAEAVAESDAAAPEKTAPADESAAGDTAPKGAEITVEVSLAEPLWPEVDVNHTLFVYAKAASGPPMPLAVQRLRAGDLPVTVKLDDSMAMTPAMRLSSFPEVTVGARISSSGQAMPQSGDMEGETGPVKRGASDPVQVLIDRVRP